MSSVVAGVDSSTQSTTVLLRDADTGALLGTGRSPHPPTVPPVSEQDPADWWTALIEAFGEARRAAGVQAADIRAVSVAAQCHGLVAMDADGTVIRPAKLWNDTTSAPEAAELGARLGIEGWVNRIGSLPTAAFTITKIAWLARHEPAAFAAMVRVLLPHDWITYRLTGQAVTDRSEASGTGYFDARRGAYDFDLLRLVDAERDWPSMVPRVLASDEIAGTITAEAASDLGISPEAVVGAGAGDQHAGAVGLGVRPGDTVFALGTSGVVYTVASDAIADTTGVVNCVADATTGFQPLICTLNATKVTDAMVRLMGIDHRTLSALAQAAPREETRPVFAAYMDGERTPNRPDARGVLAGLGSDLSREQLALAAYEGVVFGLVRGLRAIEQLGVPHDGRLIVVGGGAGSQAYLQSIADVTDRDVAVVDEPEVVAAGATVQAAAILAGRTVARQRDLWAPRARIAATPQGDPSLARVWERYLTVADWVGADAVSKEAV